MKKQMIRVLRYYKEYLKAKKNNAEKIVIIKSRKKHEIILDDRVVQIFLVVEELINSISSEYSKKIIQSYYFDRKTEKYIVSHFAISSSSFFRMKKIFENRFFVMLAAKGIVTYDDILEEKFDI